MSKIITKKDLDLVIESTLKEVDYMMENKDELKLTKQHMDGDMKKESACNECGGNMVEGMCEGCGGMSEDKEAKPDFLDLNNDGDTEEDMKDAAKEKVEESVNELTEALSKTTNKEIIKEDMDTFNKLINYRK